MIVELSAESQEIILAAFKTAVIQLELTSIRQRALLINMKTGPQFIQQKLGIETKAKSFETIWINELLK